MTSAGGLFRAASLRSPADSRVRGRTRDVPSGDEGSATVVLLGVVALAAVLAAFLGAVTTAQSGRLQAQTAADLAALAAATGLRLGDDPCSTARLVTARNGARLAGCTQEGAGVVLVVAEVSTRFGSATATARAGPSPRG